MGWLRFERCRRQGHREALSLAVNAWLPVPFLLLHGKDRETELPFSAVATATSKRIKTL